MIIGIWVPKKNGGRNREREREREENRFKLVRIDNKE
jgi:hypothetical protein